MSDAAASTDASAADGRVLQEVGCYLLAGQPSSSREIVTEAAEAERLGLGTAYISERFGHQGAVGSWPVLHLDSSLDEPIPMGITAFGPNTLELGGRCFDEVVLHTFFTEETTARGVRTVKAAAERAGRDPDAVKVWSCFATIGDHTPEDKRLMKLVGRLVRARRCP